jgi:hypothetical protein
VDYQGSSDRDGEIVFSFLIKFFSERSGSGNRFAKTIAGLIALYGKSYGFAAVTLT